jgi:uncharacterized protein YjiS (DUF1127 family)
MTILCHSAMRLLHGGLALGAIVQLQHWPHIRLISEGYAIAAITSEALMAYITTTRAPSASFFARLVALKSALTSMLNQRQIYLTTLRELNALSDRDLADLGLHRALIRDIAYQAAYGAK